jgi:hypothetical protein
LFLAISVQNLLNSKDKKSFIAISVESTSNRKTESIKQQRQNIFSSNVSRNH